MEASQILSLSHLLETGVQCSFQLRSRGHSPPRPITDPRRQHAHSALLSHTRRRQRAQHVVLLAAA